VKAFIPNSTDQDKLGTCNLALLCRVCCKKVGKFWPTNLWFY